MRYEKEQAIKLRLQGRSYLEINRLLKIPKSTLSGWLKNLSISDEAKNKILKRGRAAAIEALLKRNKQQTQIAQQRAHQIRTEAHRQIGKINNKELFFTGIALYWAEGHKKPIIYKGQQKTYHPVRLSNADPKLVQIFLRFLRESCGVENEKISAGLRIFQHQNAERLLQFWHKTTKIPISKFHKFYYGISKSSLGKKPYNLLPYGTIQIIVNDTKLYHKIMGWIEGLSKN